MLIFTFVFSVFLAIVFRYNTKTIKGYQFDGSINKLIVGDSHTQASINDKLILNSKNISQKLEGLLLTYYKLKMLLPNNHQVDTIFLGIGYHNFSNYKHEFQNSPEVISWYFFIMPRDAQITLLTESKDIFPVLQKIIIEGSENWVCSVNEYEFLGGYEPYSTPIKLSDATVDRRISHLFYVDGNETDLFEENILYFGKIVELCKEMNIKLILLNTPMHAGYKQKVPFKFINEFNRIVKNSGSG